MLRPLRFVAALIALALAPIPAAAQAPRAGGNSSNATRASTHTDSSGLQLPATPPSQPENCAVDGSIATGQLRFGFLANVPLEPEGCERRRDFWAIRADDPAAAKERLCDSALIMEAYARAGHPCARRAPMERRAWWKLW